jgi:uncharacterized membrane protein YeaQ/YmgE (transglycosylase-associated protein family)
MDPGSTRLRRLSGMTACSVGWGRPLDFAPADPHMPAMAPRTRKPKDPDRIVPDEQVEILPPGRGLVLDWRVIAPTVALGTVTGFAASLVVGGGGLLRHAVVGLLGMLVGQGLVRLTGWRVRTGYARLDEMAMAVIGAILVVLLARFIA